MEENIAYELSAATEEIIIPDKIVAIKKENEYSNWYSAIDCGEWNLIDPITDDYIRNDATNIIYKILFPIYSIPDGIILEEYQEISVKPIKAVELTFLQDEDKITCSNWKQTENLVIKMLWIFKEGIKAHITANENITQDELNSIFLSMFNSANDEEINYLKSLTFN